MKVKEAIEALSKLDGELELTAKDYDCNYNSAIFIEVNEDGGYWDGNMIIHGKHVRINH